MGFGFGYGLGSALAKIMIALFKLFILLVRFFLFTAIGRWTLGPLLIVVGLWWALGSHSIGYDWAPSIENTQYTLTCHSGTIYCYDGYGGRYFIDTRDYSAQPPSQLNENAQFLPQYVLALPEPIVAPDGFHGFGRRVESFYVEPSSPYESDAHITNSQEYIGPDGDWIGTPMLLLGGLWLLGLTLWLLKDRFFPASSPTGPGPRPNKRVAY